jgi:hypothetical protein
MFNCFISIAKATLLIPLPIEKIECVLQEQRPSNGTWLVLHQSRGMLFRGSRIS